MSFDEIQLPLRVGYGSKGGPRFSTDVVVIENGFERRNQNWAQARRTFDAKTGVRSPADVAALIAFFHARAGRARGFRLKDWSDFSSAPDNVSAPEFPDQLIGTGDGTTLSFQLSKTYASGPVSHVRAISKPVAGSVTIGVNGAKMESGWSVDTTTGIVTFAVAPASGAQVTAGFIFDVPVRFDTDTLSISTDGFGVGDCAVPIVEIRV